MNLSLKIRDWRMAHWLGMLIVPGEDMSTASIAITNTCPKDSTLFWFPTEAQAKQIGKTLTHKE